MLDPWGGEIPENTISVPTIHELSIDIRSIHGVVMLTPVSGVEENQSKYIRLLESDDGYNVVVTDNDGNVTYEDVYDDAVGVAWSEFLSKDAVYTVTAIADDNYVVTDYSIVNPLNQDEVIEFNDFESGIYQSYSWDVSLRDNKDVVINFGSGDGIDVAESENESYDLVDTSDVIMSVDMADDTAIESSDENESGETEPVQSILESEKDTLGYENIEIIPSMVGDVEVSEITKSDRKEAIADPIYEGYIRDNINSEYVDFKDLNVVTDIIVKQTLFDGDYLSGRDTIDDVMAYDVENGYNTMITQMDTYVPVYDVGDYKYYIAYVDTMHNDSMSYVVDHEFAYNNFDGEVIDDCIYDYDTGIAYVNKDYFFDDDGSVLLDCVQVQLGQVINYSDQYTESVTLDGDSESDTVDVDGFDIFIGECTFYVDKGLDPNNMNIYVNGTPCLYDYKYDPSDGSLTLYVSSALVSSVYVEDTRTIGQSILNAIFPFTIAKAETIVSEENMRTVGEVVLKKGKDDDDIDKDVGGKESATVRYWHNGKYVMGQ